MEESHNGKYPDAGQGTSALQYWLITFDLRQLSNCTA